MNNLSANDFGEELMRLHQITTFFVAAIFILVLQFLPCHKFLPEKNMERIFPRDSRPLLPSANVVIYMPRCFRGW